MPWNGPPLFPREIRYDDVESKEFQSGGKPAWGIRLALQGERVVPITVMQYRLVDSRLWAVGWWHNPPSDPKHPNRSHLGAFGSLPMESP